MTSVALVYDLRDEYLANGFSEEQAAEFDSAHTVDALASALQAGGYDVMRIGNGRALASALAAGQRWGLVFSIAEGVSGRSREAQVPALCEMFDQPYVFSDPLTMALTLDKGVAKRVVRDAGIVTAPFMIIDSIKDIPADANDSLCFPAFVKPLAEGTGKGCERASIVHSVRELQAAAAGLLQRFAQPVLVERYLPGREFTVGILGTDDTARVIGVMEIAHRTDSQSQVYSFESKENWRTLIDYSLASDTLAIEAGECALKAYRVLGCRDAARLDLRIDEAGKPAFMEANPIAGLDPGHSDLPMLARMNGVSFNELIGQIVDAACLRYGMPMSLPEEALDEQLAIPA